MIVKVTLVKQSLNDRKAGGAGGGYKTNELKIVQTHDVNNWYTLINAVYPSIVEHKPSKVIFEKQAKKGARFV